MANKYSAPSTSFGPPQTLRLPKEQKKIYVITFSEDGTLLAVATGGDLASGCLTIWEVSEHNLRQTQSIAFYSHVRAAAWFGGNAICVGLANGQIWDIPFATGTIAKDIELTVKMTAPIHNIAYDGTTQRVLVGFGRNVILTTRSKLWSTTEAIECTADDVPVEVKFHSTSAYCFIAWLQGGVQVYAHGVDENEELFLSKVWSFPVNGFSSAMSLSEDHLVIKTLFNGLAWVEIKTHDLIHTTPGWAVGPALEQQLTPIQFLGVDEVATGTDTGQIFIFKIHGNKPISTLDLHGARPQALAFKPNGPLLIVGTCDESGAILWGFDRIHDTVASSSFWPWFPVGFVVGIVFIGGVVVAALPILFNVDGTGDHEHAVKQFEALFADHDRHPVIHELFRLVTGFDQTSTQNHQSADWVQTCAALSIGVLIGAFLSALTWSRLARAPAQPAAPEPDDNPKDKGGRDSDTNADSNVNDEAGMQNPDPQGQPSQDILITEPPVQDGHEQWRGECSIASTSGHMHGHGSNSRSRSEHVPSDVLDLDVHVQRLQ